MLPETQALLNHLQEKAEAADITIHAGVDWFDSKYDAEKIRMMKDQNVGKFFGFNRPKVWLAERKAELEAAIAKLDQQQPK